MTEMQERIQGLEECARYIIEFERDHFEDFVLDGGEGIDRHIFAIAYIAMYGDAALWMLVGELKNDTSSG